jgi:NADP-dependent 3-hydroxy acid dehydrogenase YdfG
VQHGRPALAEVVDGAWREFGPIDLLGANAGVVTQGSLLEARREGSIGSST